MKHNIFSPLKFNALCLGGRRRGIRPFSLNGTLSDQIAKHEDNKQNAGNADVATVRLVPNIWSAVLSLPHSMQFKYSVKGNRVSAILNLNFLCNCNPYFFNSPQAEFY